MNGSYFQNPTFPNIDSQVEENNLNHLDNQDILDNNINKKITVYIDDKSFDGKLYSIKDNYLIINSNDEYLLFFLSNIKYLKFYEKINN